MKAVRFLFTLIGLFIVLASQVYGTEEFVSDSFREEWSTFVDSLPEEIRPMASDALQETNAADAMRETLSVSYFWNKAVVVFQEMWPSATSLLLKLTGLLVFAALFHRLRHLLTTDALRGATELCSTLCLVLCITPVIRSSVVLCQDFIALLTSCASGITPVVCALFVSSGNVTTAAVTNASLMLVYTLFQSVISVFMWPVVKAVYVMGVVGNLGGILHFDTLSRFIRQLFTWLLSLLALFLSVMIGVQSTMAINADSFSMKTAKFALGNFIPLVGNALSEAIGTVAGSLSLIKSTCGVFGVLAVAVLLLPVIVHLLLHRVVVGVAQGMAELLSCERESLLLKEVHAVLGYILAVVSLVSALFLFILALIISVRF